MNYYVLFGYIMHLKRTMANISVEMCKNIDFQFSLKVLCLPGRVDSVCATVLPFAHVGSGRPEPFSICKSRFSWSVFACLLFADIDARTSTLVTAIRSIRAGH